MLINVGVYSYSEQYSMRPGNSNRGLGRTLESFKCLIYFGQVLAPLRGQAVDLLVTVASLFGGSTTCRIRNELAVFRDITQIFGLFRNYVQYQTPGRDSALSRETEMSVRPARIRYILDNNTANFSDSFRDIHLQVALFHTST
jgi:hypothetical protein